MREKLNSAQRAAKRWPQLLVLDDAQEKVLNSLRYRDQDHHLKCGAILGFSGLLIAVNLVQLSADPGTIAYIPPTSAWLPVIRVAFIGLFLSAMLSMVSISWGRWSYSDDPWEALLQFGDLLRWRSAIEIAAIWLCALGACGSLTSLFATLFHCGVAFRCPIGHLL